MKHATLLIALCALFSLSAVAQSTTIVDNTTKRITITTKKVDDTGKTITETWIAEGDEPAKLLQEMAVNPDIIQQVTVEGDIQKVEGERLFLFRSAGDHVTFEGTLDPLATPLNEDKVIVITKDINDQVITEDHVGYWHDNLGKQRAYGFVNVGERNYNCAALGVYADAKGELSGAQISRLIDKGAAQEAGLQQGDIIRYIDNYEVSDFSTLFSALSHFRPGDRVTVKYDRDGKSLKAKADLTGWSEIPGFEHMSRSDCGQPEVPTEINPDQSTRDNPNGLSDVQTLELEDARIYPNPSDGVFSFSFNTKPGPLTVAITDVNGKVVYSDRNENASGSYQNDISIKDLPQGNYIITVNQGDKFYTQQISKQ
ncbi:MAG: PDZ domain-containing protein [Saprospiraceae bacterium]|nr:PDZ domain-containing protein [Saprospiraceae bacterium]